MALRSRSGKLAIAGALTLVGVGGGIAYAYPPGTPMEVSASAAPNGDGTADVTVTVTQVNPTCSTRIIIDGVEYAVLPPGQTSIEVPNVPAEEGRQRVRARNVNCAEGDKEHARADFTVLNGAISTDSDLVTGKNVRFELTGMAPVGAEVSVTATRLGGGSSPEPQSDRVDRRGKAKVKFKFTQSGTYAISATIDGQSVASTSVTIS
ncbi:hypothetical protein [Kineosporia babensis]|uniref:Uncharacterized protein n=1 Tax=Kineosporia babensis TaxID=499548 RepID=A0A9X1NC45_9ACTN|nr:hypothetical protein [Kineosporia babensis]MCD5311375.1 hypothetical protein [Kineosporia babensis]